MKMVRLEDLASISTGSTDTKDAVADGAYPLFDRSKTIKRSSKYLFDCEALIIPGEGTEFFPKYYSGKFDLHQRAYALFDIKAALDIQFLKYYLIFIKEYFSKVAVGATVKSLRRRHFTDLEVPLPPLSEQKTIVEKLDAAFAEIDKLEANLRKINTQAKALFDSVVDGKLQAIIHTSDLRKLKSVVDIARGGSPRPIGSYLTQESSGIPWIKISDATASGKYITTTVQKINRDGISRSRVVQPGDFLLSNSMSFGRPYIMGIEGCIHDGWLVLSDPSQNFQQDYLYFLLGSNYVFQQFNRLAAGSTVRNLNIELAGSVEIPVPALEVQHKLSEQFHSLEVETTALRLKSQKDLEIVASLKQSILSSAFTGDSNAA
jgi:type I restriction enzyme S subunit